MKPYFKEEQRFGRWWMWLLLVVLAIPALMLLYPYFDNNSINLVWKDPASLVPLLLLLAAVILLAKLKLITEIDEMGIKMNFYPLVKKYTEWHEIKSVSIVNYGFLGGWGIRYWTPYGTVYTTHGNMGLAVELKNEKNFLIGTQKVEALNNFLISIEKS